MKKKTKKKQVFYVHTNSGNAVFVKTEKFFIAQGGKKTKWGKAWKRVHADSIEHARAMVQLDNLIEYCRTYA